MRKESIGRLLLTLLTAFVMVAGVFGAAVQTWSGNQAGDESNLPNVEMAASEFDAQARGTGDAPVSAENSDTHFTEITGLWSEQSTESELNIPQAVKLDVTDPGVYITPQKQINLDDNVPTAHGTRAVTVDAGGPYGERPPDPHYLEGDTVPLEADIVGGSNDDYLFRWDLDNDTTFEGPGSAPDYWGAFGENTWDYASMDNHIGEVKVEAWDTISLQTVYGEGQPLENTYYNAYWYMYIEYVTIGWEFDISEPITVDELGMFRAYYPYQVYYVDIWDTSTQSKVATTGYMGIYPTTYAWNYWSITPTLLIPGNYIVSMYCRTYYYYGYIASISQNPSDDFVTAGNIRYLLGTSGFPTTSVSSSIYPMVSFHYQYAYQIPDVIWDVGDIWVDNVAPVVGGATAIGEPGVEGSEIGFTASFIDPGFGDDWWYRMNFGDGEVSDWVKVLKYGGGAKILFCTSWSDNAPSIANALDAELGNFDTLIDFFDWGPLGANEAPPLDLLLQYDVVIAAENYISTAPIRDDVGDVLADYSDAGGNVVTMWVSDSYYLPYGEIGIVGRWVDDTYHIFERAGLRFGGLSLGTVYDPSHPIMDGVTALDSYYGYYAPDVTPGTTRLCDDSGGYPLVGYKNNPLGSGGRIVGIDMFPTAGDCSGDYMVLMANAVKWASQAQPPYLLPMPIEVGPMYHIYKDDHPTTLTPTDIFDVTVEVRDDDHLRIFGGAGADWDGENLALAPKAVATHSGGGVGVWGPDRLNNGDKVGLYNDCWTAYGGGINWNQLEWKSPVTIGGTKSYYTRYRVLQGYCMHSCDIEYWTGSSWAFVLHYDDNDHGNHWIDAVIELPAPITTTRLRMSNMLTYTTNGNIMIQEWEVFGVKSGGDPYEVWGLGDDFTTCTIMNAFPEALASKTFQYVNDESTIVEFEGFTLFDAAMKEDTERFWYRMDYDDGTGVSPWMQTYEPAFIELEGWERDPAEWPWDPWVHVADPLFEDVNTDAAHGGVYGLEIDQGYTNMWTYRTDVEVGKQGDTLTAWWQPPNVGTYGGRSYLGFGADSTGCWSFVLAPNTNQIFFYNDHPWTSFVMVGSAVSYVFSHDDWYFAEIEWITQETVTGRLYDTDGTTLLAEVTATISGLAPGGVAFRCFDYGGQAHHNYLDQYHTIARDPIFPTTLHQYMDNGIYYVDYMVIDDDMWWDFSSGYPVFMGPPGEDPNDWISHNVFPVEIENVDPVISPKIRAYVELDLSLRMSGNKHNTATMRVIENGANIGEVTVYRDPGSPDIGVLPAVIEMTKDFDYQLEIEYDPDDLAGANPTWIFSAHWPDGKFKELKHTFNSNDPSDRVWVIPNLKSMMLGHDVIFEAEAKDDGSDDLAFIWNWGDRTPFGVHIFANADPDVEVGVTDEATVIFNQDPDRDPWFDKGPNTVRSPFGTGMDIQDSITHVFDEGQPYYYYVMLTVLDDDVEDDYPSTQLHTRSGLDYTHVEIDFA